MDGQYCCLPSERVMGAASGTYFSLWELRPPLLSPCSVPGTLAAPSVQPGPPVTLTVPCPRDLTDNQLTTLPLAGLGGLMHLKLRGNPALSQAFSKDSFPKLR